jgi:oligoribonuclease NrnB/cAMP/cGMP phosphodiesterase (DHH superfamily)
MQPLVIYHDNCADGFGAAWAFWKRYPNAEFVAASYNGRVFDVAERDVYILDFSYKAAVTAAMYAKCKTITIFDHHKTAIEDLEPLRAVERCGRLKMVFDVNRSGAMITWNELFPNVEPPQLLKHIQDRDLWKFELDDTREIITALFAYDYNFATWDVLMQCDMQELVREGRVLDRKYQKDLKQLIKTTKRMMYIGGELVPVANLPPYMASDAGHIMSKDAPFAATYHDTSTARKFSLRSNEEGEDVSKIASWYGGGGHKHAAGFEVPRNHSLAEE